MKLLYLAKAPYHQKDDENIESILDAGWSTKDLVILHACPHLESTYSDVNKNDIIELYIPGHANTEEFWEHAWKLLPQYIHSGSRFITLSWFDDQYGLFTENMYNCIQTHPIGRVDFSRNIIRHILTVPPT